MTKFLSSWRQFAAVCSVALLAACTSHPTQQSQASATYTNPSVRMTATDIGTVMSTLDGMTLYTYDKDARGQSNCYGKCAEYWPPFLDNTASRPAGELGLITRSDGKMQWANNGKPLYTFAKDKSPGEVNGDNYHNIWHVVR